MELRISFVANIGRLVALEGVPRGVVWLGQDGLGARARARVEWIPSALHVSV